MFTEMDHCVVVHVDNVHQNIKRALKRIVRTVFKVGVFIVSAIPHSDRKHRTKKQL